MSTMRKCLMITGAAVLSVVGIMLVVKANSHHSEPAGMLEKVGKGIDERLSESKESLDKATAHVQSILESIKGKKS